MEMLFNGTLALSGRGQEGMSDLLIYPVNYWRLMPNYGLFNIGAFYT